ncbi:MAG: RES family NAD+ phosphorylase [Cyanobacteria bacterium]|nr:RES family NAD+ phosphorylase [Cyanobacteriota bacterium]
MVKIEAPPPQRGTDPLLHNLPASAQLLRIYRPHPYGSRACGFRFTGPFSRFDHHEPGQKRGIHYSALTLSACIVEVFGDTGLVEPDGVRLALIRTNRDLALLDLCGSGAMRAGSVTALAATADRDLSQQWSRFFYATSPVDGLLYSNAHNGETAVVLYERAEAALCCVRDLELAEPQLRSRLLAIAREHAMVVTSPAA